MFVRAGRRDARRREPSRMADELTEHKSAQAALRRGPSRVFHIGATRLDDAPIGNARWAHALAGPAAQTQVDVLDLLLVERHGAALPLRHQVDAAARRLGLETGDAKGRARVQAQPAVDAGREGAGV